MSVSVPVGRLITLVLVHQVSDWCSGAAANFGRMREAKRENTRCGLSAMSDKAVGKGAQPGGLMLHRESLAHRCLGEDFGNIDKPIRSSVTDIDTVYILAAEELVRSRIPPCL